MSFEETSEVRYGRTTIEYAIRRSARRKTVAIAIDPLEGVLLTAPPGVHVSQLDRVVKAKAQWIVDRLRHVAGGEPAPPPKQFVTGESFAYLGRHYRLRVIVGEQTGARVNAGWLEVGVEKRLEDGKRVAAIQAAVRGWYLAHAKRRLDERVEIWAARAGVEVAGVLVRDQQKRWASCDDKGVLRFNWRIVQAPMRLVDYVVAHEIVHLIHPDHTKAFWARLGAVMPDYERRKDELRRLGRRLEW
ncbi:putative metal-dependent hydrolase [Enhygromyxa salina]|uniref:Putative metal-dependent hydrolase n=1 Tax=Enhygromyxa salina TaxID=215803 RepID=A0A0C2CYJ9_9BACT|nr:SprT family zinc-dependent metalloprotease [Enhygromyxa salina]KIG12937.1 putative metal-dependent hydrolase [Enhygromyxa salina]